MRKSPFVLLASLLLASPLLSQKLPEGFELSEGRRGKPAPAAPWAAPGQRAFFSLAGEMVPPGLHELKFEVRIDGRLALEDAIQLPFDAAGGTVELLAGDPEGLARLFSRAEKAGNRAEISVLLNGKPLETFTLAEFLDYNRRFQETPPPAIKPLGEKRTFLPENERETPSGRPVGQLTKGGYYDPSCVAGCDAQRDYCYQTDPSCATVFICDACENEYSSCYQYCWVCTDPRSVSEHTTSSIYSATWLGSSCLKDVFNSKYWYDYYNLVIRNYRWQRTHYCNGTYSDSLLYTWDTSGSCLSNLFYNPCSFSTGNAFPPYCPF